MGLKWQNIIDCNAESMVFISKINDSYIGQKFDPLSMQFFTLNILCRLTLIQKGVDPLLREIESNPNLELPIGILLRSACLDILLYGYIHKCMDEVEINEKNPSPNVIPDFTKFKFELAKVFSDNLKNQLDDDKLLKEVGIINEEEYNDRVELLKTTYPWLLDNNKFPISGSARYIFKTLKSNSRYEIYSNAFRFYSYYSKLEHFGILSFLLTTSEHYKNNDSISRIYVLLMTILNTYGYGLIYLQRDEQDLNKIDEILKKLLKEHL